MKISALFMLQVFLMSAETIVAQTPFLTIYNYYGEKGRDSHATTENISINGSTATYSVKYTGRKNATQQNEEKFCTLTIDQLEKINKAIAEKNLNKTDSIILVQEEGIKDRQYATASVIITATKAGGVTKTKCKGDPTELAGKPLYDNSLYLFRLVKKMVDSCR